MAQAIVVCTKCGEPKTADDFPFDCNKRSGLSSWCRTCHRAQTRERAKSPAGKAYRNAYRQTPKGKESVKRSNAKTRLSLAHLFANRRFSKSPKGRALSKRSKAKIRGTPMAKAHQKVKKAVEMGRMPSARTMQCSGCDKPAAHYHHYLGYEPEHWFHVVPLCAKCHVAADKALRQSQSSQDSLDAIPRPASCL
jgi:hypothetical protein